MIRRTARRLIRLLDRAWRYSATMLAVLLVLGAFFLGLYIADPTGEGPVAAAEVDETVYTCSMCPQVRTTDPDANCPICGMDLIPAAEMDDDPSESASERRMSMSTAAVALAQIVTAPVERRTPEAEVRLVGELDYDETRLAEITAYFPARIERLFLDFTGMRVQRGEHVAEVYSPELFAAQEELLQAIRAADTAGDADTAAARAARATLRAARERLRLWGLTESQIREIETRGTASDTLTIHAPIGGVVVERAALEGRYVQTGSSIATLADLNHLWVKLDAYESDLHWLRFGQNVTFTTPSRPGERFEGTISFISPTVSQRSRTARVRVNVENPDGRLKPGMFVQAVVRPTLTSGGVAIGPDLRGKWISPMHPEIVRDEPGECDVCGMDLVPAEDLGYVTEPDPDAEPPLVIPATAPLITGTRAVVYVTVPGRERPTFELRDVTLGPRAGDVYIVKSGLEEGDRVVVHGNFKIDSAMQLGHRPSMMSPVHEPDHLDAPESFLEALDDLIRIYLGAQEALADDNLTDFLILAERLIDAAETLDADPPESSDAREAWASARDHLTGALTEAIDAGSLDAARVPFEHIAMAAIHLAERFGHDTGDSLYVVHCPMAFDDEGADWLQRGEEVNNPYFGASMLRCGTVERRVPGRDDVIRGEPAGTGHDHGDHNGHGGH